MARLQDHHSNNDEENRDKINDLKLNLDTLNEKLKKSEQAKEHWKLECQLLQMKLTKLKKSTAIGKKQALKKYDQFTPNTSCFWGKCMIKYYLSCAISQNLCYKNNE